MSLAGQTAIVTLTPEQVAFFALPESGYITGQVLSVNGGSSRLG